MFIRYASLASLLVLLGFDIHAENSPAPTAANVVVSDVNLSNEPNVVLGRELVKLTKAIEEATRAEREVVSLRSEIAAMESGVDISYRGDGETTESLEVAKQRLDLISDGLSKDVAEEIKRIREKLNDIEGSSTENEGDISTSAETDMIRHELASLRQTISSEERFLEDLASRLQNTRYDVQSRRARLSSFRHRLDSIRTLATSLDSSAGTTESYLSFGNVGGFGQSADFPAFMPGNSPDDAIPPPVGTQDLLGEIRSVERSLVGLQTKAKALTSRHERTTKMWKATTEESKTLATTAETIKSEIASRAMELRNEKDAIEDALSQRDAGLNQFEINKLLVWAVYGMIASIIALFVLLIWLPSSLTDLIVEQRVVVEVLSMGFLLVTVIILGSAKLIQGEGLAGLLGTIAGYIFAKKTADLLGADRDSDPTASLGRQLLQSELEVASLDAKLKQLTASVGESPSKKQQLQIADTKQKLEQARARALVIKDSFTRASRRLPSLSEPSHAPGGE